MRHRRHRRRRRGILLKSFIALLLAALAVMTLLIACTGGVTPDSLILPSREPAASSAAAKEGEPSDSPSSGPSGDPTDPSEEPPGDPSEEPAPGPTSTPAPDPYADAVLEPYDGPVEHIFYHPLVVYPELAFYGGSYAQGMDDYMATPYECRAILQQMYDNGWVLIDINEVYKKEPDENGKMVMKRQSFLFPKGKKPYVISTDDMNYYPYMLAQGCNFKVILDENGEIAMYSETPDGRPNITYDTEVMTIVDQFVRENPDASFNGAKGIIGLTGWEGILGYRVTSDDPEERAREIEAVKPVIAKLKENGWTFASHSWGHPNFETTSMERIKTDTDKWKQHIEPLVGPTRVFLYPYGAYIRHKDENMARLNYLIDVGGFDILCGVSTMPYAKVYEKYAFEVRKNIDGLTLRNRRAHCIDLFDCDTVIDPSRNSALARYF